MTQYTEELRGLMFKDYLIAKYNIMREGAWSQGFTLFRLSLEAASRIVEEMEVEG